MKNNREKKMKSYDLKRGNYEWRIATSCVPSFPQWMTSARIVPLEDYISASYDTVETLKQLYQ